MSDTRPYPDNKFRIYYDHEAEHYRVWIDDVELSHNIALGGIKVDFSTMVTDSDDQAPPEVTLTFHAEGGIEITLPDGRVITGEGEGA